MRKGFFFFILSLVSTSLFSQDTTNRGTDFWVGYGLHQFMENGSNSQEMVLYFSTGNQPAIITLTIDSSGLTGNPTSGWRRVYHVPANTVVSIDNYAATSYTSAAGSVGTIPKGTSGQYDARLYSVLPPTSTGSVGLFRKKGIHIESDVPIAVHAHIYGATSSGATMVLPVKAWGYTYYSINSRQEYAPNTFSWLFVIAKEDSTIVEISPSVLTRLQNVTGLQPKVPKRIVLQKGQIYQVISANDGADINGNGGTSSRGKDITGTKIKALVKGRPVAVFAGSSRTANPASCGSGGGDNDIAQLFPLHVWGKRYLTVPTSSSAGASSFSFNTYKIAVYDPSTIVRRNGIILSSLVNNAYYTFESNTPEFIEADKPISVAQFMGGGACNPGGLGDPDMYYLSPIDGGVKKVNSIRSNKEAIAINYLSLIVPTTAISSLRIDNSSLLDYSFPHPQLTGYTIAVKQWAAAKNQFVVECDSAFTGITYGIGTVESYGFNIGAKYNPLHGVDSMYRVKWLGTKDSNWMNGDNWSTGVVPLINDHVFIDAGTPNNVVIMDGLEVACQSLELASGAVLTVKSLAKLHVVKPQTKNE